MNTRIKYIVEESGKTQIEFAKSVGISRTALQKLISGENNPRENTIREICRVYNVSRKWLEEGVGEIRVPLDDDRELIDQWLDNCSEMEKACLLSIIKTPGGWEKLAEIMLTFQKLNKTKNPDE